MTARIDFDSRLNPKRFTKLAEHPAVQEIENYGTDDGCFFVHLKIEFDYNFDPFENRRTQTFSSIKEAHKALKNVKPAHKDKAN